MRNDDRGQSERDEKRGGSDSKSSSAPRDGSTTGGGASQKAQNQDSTASRPRGTTEDPDRTL